MSPIRRRRSAEAARAEILDAADRRLAVSGPAGLRLQDIASDVGVSHPAVLHHFGSREALVKAVVQRAIRRLEEELAATLGAAATEWLDPVAVVERVSDTLGKRGQARLLAWLILSGHEPFRSKSSRAKWAKIVELMHDARVKLAMPGQEPKHEDTVFAVLLSSLALFGEALGGHVAFKSVGLSDDAATARRFHEWLAALMLERLAKG